MIDYIIIPKETKKNFSLSSHNKSTLCSNATLSSGGNKHDQYLFNIKCHKWLFRWKYWLKFCKHRSLNV